MLTSELAYWITERYSIKLRRAQGLPPPWSADPVFQTTRFTNVHREDDAVTIWIRREWNRADDPMWKFVLGRMINLVGSLNELIPLGYDLTAMQEQLEDRRARGLKVFTSAYTISTCGQKMDKIDYVMGVVKEVRGQEHVYRGITSCAVMAKELRCIDGLGSFLAAQVVADLKNTPGHPLQTAPDRFDWCAPGPGSLRGLSAYHGRVITPGTFDAAIKQAYHAVIPLVPAYVPPIDMQDFQNVMCEFSKYVKVKAGGHARNKVHYV